MIKILFVCYGNICRSPMAEFIFKDMVRRAGCEDEYYIASAATSSEEIRNGRGNPVYPPAREKLAEHGLFCRGKRAVQMKRSDYKKYDLLIGMDHENLYSMKRISGGDPDRKIHLLLDYTRHPRDVSDPWYTDDFETAYRDILEGCRGLFSYLKKNSFTLP